MAGAPPVPRQYCQMFPTRALEANRLVGNARNRNRDNTLFTNNLHGPVTFMNKA
jgi:hypothetical protein